LQSDPKFSNVYFNMSSGNDFTGPWNDGKTTQLKETIQFVEDPVDYVLQTNGLLEHEAAGTDRTEEAVRQVNQQMSKLKSAQVTGATPPGIQQWNNPLPEENTDHTEKSNNATKRRKKSK
jgi:Mn-containing catalase